MCIRENERLLERQRDMYQDKATNNPASAHSLVELLDGIIMLYNIAAHKQLGKVSTRYKQLGKVSTRYKQLGKVSTRHKQLGKEGTDS